MSPMSAILVPIAQNFPRVSGDEPGILSSPPASCDFPRGSGDEPLMGLATTLLTEFSPRERG